MKKILFILLFLLSFSFISSVKAGGVTIGGGTTFTNTDTVEKYKKENFNPLPNITSLPQYASTLINALLGVIGSIALIMFTYSGFRWMTASGDAKAVQTSQQTMLWTGLGLVMIFSSYALVKFVIGAAGG